MKKLQSHENENNPTNKPGNCLIQEEQVMPDVYGNQSKKEEDEDGPDAEGDREFENI